MQESSSPIFKNWSLKMGIPLLLLIFRDVSPLLQSNKTVEQIF